MLQKIFDRINIESVFTSKFSLYLQLLHMHVQAVNHQEGNYRANQLSYKDQDDTFSFFPLAYYQNCIGVIRGEWFSLNDSKRMESICYGTAIALSKRVILTCAHSLYLDKKRRICDNISFILNQQKGVMGQSQKIYKAAEANFIRLEELTELQTFSKKALPEDLALVYICEDLPIEEFPDIGLDVSLISKQVSVHNNLYLSGYPSSQYFNKIHLRSISYNRVDLQGTLKGIDIDSSTLYHNLDTKTGHSGSAIFARNSQTYKPTIIGIHTHKGRVNNSGVLLTELLLKRIASYDLFFALRHPQYDASVKLPPNIRTAAFQDLSFQDQNSISQKSLQYRFYQQNDADDSDTYSEMDQQMFIAESDQKKQELIDHSISFKIIPINLLSYCSIEQYQQQNNSNIKMFSCFEQTISCEKQQITVVQTLFECDRKSDIVDRYQEADAWSTKKKQKNIGQIDVYLEKNIHQRSLMLQLCIKNYSDQSDQESIPQIKIKEHQSKYSSLSQSYCTQREENQLAFKSNQQSIHFQSRE